MGRNRINRGKSIEAALMLIGRRFINPYGSAKAQSGSKYMPHQGAKECARRRRQGAAGVH